MSPAFLIEAWSDADTMRVLVDSLLERELISEEEPHRDSYGIVLPTAPIVSGWAKTHYSVVSDLGSKLQRARDLALYALEARTRLYILRNARVVQGARLRASQYLPSIMFSVIGGVWSDKFTTWDHRSTGQRLLR